MSREAPARDRVVVGAVLIGVVIRVAVWSVVPAARFESDEASYYQAGLALLSRGEQDLFWPPFTGWLIAGASWVLHSTALPVLRLVWIAMDAGCLLAVAALSQRVARVVAPEDGGRARRIARWATIGYALYLPAISFAQFTTSEVPALLQTLGVLLVLTAPRVTTAAAVLSGALLGTLVLTRPSLLPLLALMPLWVARYASWPARGRRALLIVSAGCTVILLLVARNAWVEGEATIARNGAYNLLVGNRDVYAEDLDLFSPRATPEQVRFRREFFSGTLQYPTGTPAEMQREALAWIAAHPVTFARRAMGRLARVFAPKTDVLELAGGERAAGIFSPVSLGLLGVANAEWACLLACGGAGLVALRRRHPAWGALWMAAIGGAVLLCLVAIAKPRYSFVFDPWFIIGAAILVTAPRATWAGLTSADRRALLAAGAFLAWGWAAWFIFALTSRLALGA